MEYDILKMDKKGLNWAKNLPEYQHILNKDPKNLPCTKMWFKTSSDDIDNTSKPTEADSNDNNNKARLARIELNYVADDENTDRLTRSGADFNDDCRCQNLKLSVQL